MNALLAFLFSFLLFANAPAAVDTPVTANIPATAEAPMATESPRIMHFQAPSYPEMAWQEKVHGKVTLKILVYKDGRFDLLEDAVKRGAIKQSAVDDYCGDLLGVVNVVERVGAE